MSTLEEDKKEMTEGREEMVFSCLYNILLLLILKEKTRLILRKKDWKSKISTYILGKNEGLPLTIIRFYFTTDINKGWSLLSQCHSQGLLTSATISPRGSQKASIQIVMFACKDLDIFSK